jgi:hypothetical protein
MSKKMYCNPLEWVEKKDKALFDAINDLCMEGDFSSSTRLGVTWIHPSKPVRAKIVELVGSGSDEVNSDGLRVDDEEAARLIKDHLIRRAIPTPDAASRGMGNGNGKTIEVTSTSSSGFTVKGGAKVKLEASYHCRLGKSVVYAVESGELPSDGEPFRFKNVRGSEKLKTGGDGGSAACGSKSAREATFELIMHRHQDYMHVGKHQSMRPPLMEYAVSLLNFIKLEFKATFDTIMPLMDRNPFVSIVLLIQPYKTHGKYIVSDTILNAWGGHFKIYKDMVNDYKGFFDQGNPNAAKIIQAADKLRVTISSSGGARDTSGMMMKAYEDLFQNNRIGECDNVLPAVTRTLFGTVFKNAREYAQFDELRFTLHRAITMIGEDNRYTMDQILNLICEIRSFNSNPNPAATTRMFNANNLIKTVSGSEIFKVFVTNFLNSTDFLHVCIPNSQVFDIMKLIPTRNVNDLNTANVHASDLGKQAANDVTHKEMVRLGLNTPSHSPGDLAAAKLKQE